MTHAVILHRSDLMQLALHALLTDALKYQPLTADRFVQLEDALPVIQKTTPTLVIFEDQPQAILTARSFREAAPQSKQIVIGVSTDCDFIGQLIRAGIIAYVHLHDPLMKCFPTAVRLGQVDRTYLSPLVSADYKALVGSRRPRTLDKRSQDVLQMLIDGRSVNDIVEQLDLSQDAVYRVRARLRQWFGVTTNEAVIERAMAQGYSATGGVR
jgi:DNA-binding NarL/FixJ family response regulator